MAPEFGNPLAGGLTGLVGLLVCAAPALLFFGALGPGLCDPRRVDAMQHDDFEYVARSLTLRRAVANLFVPHATHIVPSWRLLTWGVVCSAGRLSSLPNALAIVSYGAEVAVMLVTGRLVACEIGRTSAGLAAAAAGISALMMPPATWYAAGQTLWAALGILATLVCLQSWRRRGGSVRLALAALSAIVAGWFWTIGYLAGPVGAIFLCSGGSRRCRRAAVVPLAAGAIVLIVALVMGGRMIDARQSLHGLGLRQAIDPLRGLLHTAQAIPEYLIVGGLGLSTETNPLQGAIVCVFVAVLWIWSRRDGWRFNRLECSGAALMFGSYFIEWTVRGYAPFRLLRVIVPWYHVIPQIGAVLFVFGWLSGPLSPNRPDLAAPARLTWGGMLGVTLLTISLVVLNRPRVEALWESSVLRTIWEITPERTSNRKGMPTRKVALNHAKWQRKHLVKLGQAEATARRLGIGRDAIHRVFGRLDVPPNLPMLCDGLDLLDLAPAGPETDADRIRRALGQYLRVSPEPQPPT